MSNFPVAADEGSAIVVACRVDAAATLGAARCGKGICREFCDAALRRGHEHSPASQRARTVPR